MNQTAGAARQNSQAVIREVLTARSEQPGALLPILHDIQEHLGYVPPEAVPEIASVLNLSRAEVHGVITFYHHFRTEKPRGPVVAVCRAEACQSCGSDALWDHANKQADKAGIAVEAVYCLGLCATAPSMSINDKPYARVSAAKFDRLVSQLKEAA